jgi:DNA-binding NarL/FixJ family response regulator
VTESLVITADWNRAEMSGVETEKRERPASNRARVRRAVGRTMGPMTATGPDGVRGDLERLTPRQRVIVWLLGQGMSSAAIAATLGLTTSAITSQRARIRSLLGLGTEWELTRYAILVSLAVELPSRKPPRPIPGRSPRSLP